MPNLPAVSLRRFGSVMEVSFHFDVVEDIVIGPHGHVRLRGGPALNGSVREAVAKPLGQFVVLNPVRTPEQLANRDKLGRALVMLSLLNVPEGTREYTFGL